MDSTHEPKALAVDDRRGRTRRKDPNDPSWLARQSCWACGRTGHIRQKCPAPQSERDEYRERKLKEKGAMVTESSNAGAANDEVEVYSKAMIAEDSASIARSSDDLPKRWIIDSGCSNHFSPNKSAFVTYIPYASPKNIRLGDASLIPSLGEGTVKLTCIVNGSPVTRYIHDVQYVPAMAYALLSCKVLNQRGLSVLLKDGRCKIRHPDGTLIAQSSTEQSRLYFLHTADYPVSDPGTNDVVFAATPSFDLVHKRLAHPGKDALQLMIQQGLAIGLEGIPDESQNFDCIPCIQGKMTHRSFQWGHEVAVTQLGHVHSDVCGPMETTSLGGK